MRTALLDHLSTLADTTRDRLLLLLERHELTVGELCSTVQLPQSTVSRHLKALSDSGWVIARAEGTSHLYSMRAMTRGSAAPGRSGSNGTARLDSVAQRLWMLVREDVHASPPALQDQRRLQRVLATRRTRSQQFFASSAGEWDRLREELFGDTFHLAALAAFIDPEWTVGDLGCGTGQVSAALSPLVARVVAVDESAAMLGAATTRLAGTTNVDIRRGDVEALPVEDGWLDAATLILVLHHVPEPGRALAEVARVLQDRLCLVSGGVDARQMRHGGQLLPALNAIDDGQCLFPRAAAGAIGHGAEIRAQLAERRNGLLEEHALSLVGPGRKELERERRALVLPGRGQDVADMGNQGLVGSSAGSARVSYLSWWLACSSHPHRLVGRCALMRANRPRPSARVIAAALVVAERAKDLKDGVRIAAEAIDSGEARVTLDKLIEITNRASAPASKAKKGD